MSSTKDEATCTDGSEHQIGQNYDERRGTGNGPQICLKCKRSLKDIFVQFGIDSRIDELTHVSNSLYELADTHEGNVKEIWKVHSDNLIRIAELTTLRDTQGRK